MAGEFGAKESSEKNWRPRGMAEWLCAAGLMAALTFVTGITPVSAGASPLPGSDRGKISFIESNKSGAKPFFLYSR